MSHFAVAVITDKQPTIELLTEILQPWHEYECTGVKDQYVIFEDHHDEIVKEWNEKTEERLFHKATGEMVSRYDDRFYRDPTPAEIADAGPLGLMGTGSGGGISYTSKDWGDGKGHRARIRFEPDPELYQAEQVPVQNLYDNDIEKFAQEEHGYVLENGRFGRWTNPNKKGDWWQVGGRYSGLLTVSAEAIAKAGTDEELAVVGERSWTNRGEERGELEADGARIDILDLDAMLKSNQESRAKSWDAFESECNDPKSDLKSQREALNTLPALLSWGQIAGLWAEKREELYQRWQAYRDEIRAADADAKFLSYGDWLKEHHPEMSFAASVHHLASFSGVSINSSQDATRESYIARARAFSTYAVVKDGEWFQRGEMGWWGMASDEKDEQKWADEFDALMRSLKPTQWVTVVDCHI